MAQKICPTSPVFAAAFCCAIGVTATSGATAARKSYEVPGGDAAATLTQFARNSGCQIVYLIENVRGEKTQPVRGEYAALDALRVMLTGTALFAVQDDSTGALVVSRKRPAPAQKENGESARSRDPPPSPSPAHPSAQPIPPSPKKADFPPVKTSSPQTSDSPSMKKRSIISFFASLLTLGLSGTENAKAENANLPASAADLTGRVQNIVTGQYLNNARIRIKGADLIAFTDPTGTYRISNVPAGKFTLEVLYTGLDLYEAPVSITAGASIRHDVSLTNRQRYGDLAEIVKLDAFITTSARETDAGAIAINEQRFSSNIKNVVAPDAYGDTIGGNVGDFLKYIPGVLSADPGSSLEASQISIRGFAASFTGFSMDGAKMANANSTGSGRAFELNQSSIAHVARVEITKVPTPSDPADSMAGSINLVSKSAFERSRAELRYRVGLTGNSEDFSLRRTPDPFERMSYKAFPSFDFDYTLPLGKNFGLVFTGLHSKMYYVADTAIHGYQTSGAGTGASLATPYMNVQDSRANNHFSTRDALSFKADWRVTPNSVLSACVQTTYFVNHTGSNTLVQNTGTTGTPTVATGTPFSYGPAFTVGATGRGSLSQSGSLRHTRAAALNGSVNYRFNNGTWIVDSGVTRSYSRNWFRDTSEGYFTLLTISNAVPVRVTFREIGVTGAGKIEVFDNSDRPMSIYDPKSYRITDALVTPQDVRDEVHSARLSIARAIDFLPFPTSVKIGGLAQKQARDSVSRRASFTYTPPDGNLSTQPFLAQVYGSQTLPFQKDGQVVPWVSFTRAWDAYRQSPTLFTQTPAQVVQTARDYITNSRRIEEAVSAAYVQSEARMLNSRLKILTGVRLERTEDSGFGPRVDTSAVFARNANGTFVRDTAGNRVRRPEAGAPGSMEELRLTSQERGFRAVRAYDGFYPSLHLTYNLRENLLARFAYARSFGRPDFANIIPTITETQNLDTTTGNELVPGTITLANTALKPWSADNYDLSVEYYASNGGFYSAGVFTKDIRDFFGNATKIATAADVSELGLDSRYVGWQVTSKFNSGNARVTGYEFAINQSLEVVGGWGKYFSVFVNGTKLRLEGNQAADFPGFIPESVNWGFSFRKKPMTFGARWNYRGKLKTATQVPALGTNGYFYIKPPHPRLDLNADYTFSKRVLAYVSVKNALNVPFNGFRYADETPDYAKPYQVSNNGVLFEFGIKGAF